MIEIIKKYYKIIIPVLIVLFIVLFAFMFRKEDGTGQTANDQGEYISDYKFLKADIPKENKYLMILAKNLVEDYGTYSKDDTRDLLDLQNQSTAEFGSTVQGLINDASRSTGITTVVDPDSIELQQITATQYRVSMIATTTDNITNKTTQSGYIVVLVKVNGYWLVKNITTP